MMIIDHFDILRFAFPRDRVIGDAQVRSPNHYQGVLELHTQDGRIGYGFFGALFHPLPDVVEMKQRFEMEVFPALHGQNPFALVNRLSRPRGGNRSAAPYGFGQAVDQALWDLQGKILDLPLYKLLGGTSNKVPAYASGLGYHMSHEQIAAFFRQAQGMGFTAFKVKVGHPTLEWDIERLQAVVDAVGADATLMIDANETWPPKEAIRRLHAYRDAGFNIYWIEDPCLRDDFEGLRRVSDAVPFAHINTGEYLDLSGKRRLLESGAVDIMNVHGQISDVLKAAWLAGEYGIPVALGNTPFELGVHLAAALPEVIWMEYSFHNHDHLLKAPVRFEGGYAYAPERPGHGLEIADEARVNSMRPGVNDIDETAPPGPIQL